MIFSEWIINVYLYFSVQWWHRFCFSSRPWVLAWSRDPGVHRKLKVWHSNSQCRWANKLSVERGGGHWGVLPVSVLQTSLNCCWLLKSLRARAASKQLAAGWEHRCGQKDRRSHSQFRFLRLTLQNRCSMFDFGTFFAGSALFMARPGNIYLGLSLCPIRSHPSCAFSMAFEVCNQFWFCGFENNTTVCLLRLSEWQKWWVIP